MTAITIPMLLLISVIVMSATLAAATVPAFSQPPVDIESGIAIDELDIPEYDYAPNTDAAGEATESQLVEVDDNVLENVQYRNITLDLDIQIYFNCVSAKSLPLYQIQGEDFRSKSPLLYIMFMEQCLSEQQP